MRPPLLPMRPTSANETTSNETISSGNETMQNQTISNPDDTMQNQTKINGTESEDTQSDDEEKVSKEIVCMAF
jgi:hypothetical protein